MASCGIYKIQNLINNKVYIGQSVDINYRFKNHISDSFNPKSKSYDTAIHRAIRKYGVDNFSFEIIENCDVDKLNDREIYWIKKYDSYGNGYNMTHGGEGVSSIDRQYVYDLWDQGMSVGEISDYAKHDKHSIIHILKNYDNYSNDESYKRGRILASKNNSRKIKQYDLNGNFISMYDNINEAAQIVNTKAANIRAVICGLQLTAAGFQWVLEGQESPGICKVIGKNEKRPVVQLDKDKQFIAEYESVSLATKSINLKNPNSIVTCCKGKGKTAGGYYWMYSEDYYKKENN